MAFGPYDGDENGNGFSGIGDASTPIATEEYIPKSFEVDLSQVASAGFDEIQQWVWTWQLNGGKGFSPELSSQLTKRLTDIGVVDQIDVRGMIDSLIDLEDKFQTANIQQGTVEGGEGMLGTPGLTEVEVDEVIEETSEDEDAKYGEFLDKYGIRIRTKYGVSSLIEDFLRWEGNELHPNFNLADSLNFLLRTVNDRGRLFKSEEQLELARRVYQIATEKGFQKVLAYAVQTFPDVTKPVVEIQELSPDNPNIDYSSYQEFSQFNSILVRWEIRLENANSLPTDLENEVLALAKAINSAPIKSLPNLSRLKLIRRVKGLPQSDKLTELLSTLPIAQIPDYDSFVNASQFEETISNFELFGIPSVYTEDILLDMEASLNSIRLGAGKEQMLGRLRKIRENIQIHGRESFQGPLVEVLHNLSLKEWISLLENWQTSGIPDKYNTPQGLLTIDPIIDKFKKSSQNAEELVNFNTTFKALFESLRAEADNLGTREIEDDEPSQESFEDLLATATVDQVRALSEQTHNNSENVLVKLRNQISEADEEEKKLSMYQEYLGKLAELVGQLTSADDFEKFHFYYLDAEQFKLGVHSEVNGDSEYEKADAIMYRGMYGQAIRLFNQDGLKLSSGNTNGLPFSYDLSNRLALFGKLALKAGIDASDYTENLASLLLASVQSPPDSITPIDLEDIGKHVQQLINEGTRINGIGLLPRHPKTIELLLAVGREEVIAEEVLNLPDITPNAEVTEKINKFMTAEVFDDRFFAEEALNIAVLNLLNDLKVLQAKSINNISDSELKSININLAKLLKVLVIDKYEYGTDVDKSSAETYLAFAEYYTELVNAGLQDILGNIKDVGPLSETKNISIQRQIHASPLSEVSGQVKLLNQSQSERLITSLRLESLREISAYRDIPKIFENMQFRNGEQVSVTEVWQSIESFSNQIFASPRMNSSIIYHTIKSQLAYYNKYKEQLLDITEESLWAMYANTLQNLPDEDIRERKLPIVQEILNADKWSSIMPEGELGSRVKVQLFSILKPELKDIISELSQNAGSLHHRMNSILALLKQFSREEKDMVMNVEFVGSLLDEIAEQTRRGALAGYAAEVIDALWPHVPNVSEFVTMAADRFQKIQYENETMNGNFVVLGVTNRANSVIGRIRTLVETHRRLEGIEVKLDQLGQVSSPDQVRSLYLDVVDTLGVLRQDLIDNGSFDDEREEYKIRMTKAVEQFHSQLTALLERNPIAHEVMTMLTSGDSPFWTRDTYSNPKEYAYSRAWFLAMVFTDEQISKLKQAVETKMGDFLTASIENDLNNNLSGDDRENSATRWLNLLSDSIHSQVIFKDGDKVAKLIQRILSLLEMRVKQFELVNGSGFQRLRKITNPEAVKYDSYLRKIMNSLDYEVDDYGDVSINTNYRSNFAKVIISRHANLDGLASRFSVLMKRVVGGIKNN